MNKTAELAQWIRKRLQQLQTEGNNEEKVDDDARETTISNKTSTASEQSEQQPKVASSDSIEYKHKSKP